MLTAPHSWAIFVGLMKWRVFGETHRPSSDDLASCNKASLEFLINRHRLGLAFASLLGTRYSSLYEVCRFLTLQKTLVDIFRAFDEDNIFAVCLKGVALNQLLYGKECLRQSRDIDLWVAPDMVIRAHECLVRMGFALDSLDPALLTSSKASSYLKHFEYVNVLNTIRVELHQRLSFVSEIPFPTPERCHFTTVLDTSIPTLDLESYFVYLCQHAASHHWIRLQWLVDLAVFYNKLRPNWAEVARVSYKTDSTRAVIETRFLLHSFFGIDLPPIRASFSDRFCTWIRLHSFKNRWYIDIPHWRVILLNSLLYSTFRHKCHLIMGYILNSRYGRLEMLKTPNSPIWCTMMTLFAFFTQRVRIGSKATTPPIDWIGYRD